MIFLKAVAAWLVAMFLFGLFLGEVLCIIFNLEDNWMWREHGD